MGAENFPEGVGLQNVGGRAADVEYPGERPQLFHFTVRSDSVAAAIEQSMGKQVEIKYEEHQGVPFLLWRHAVLRDGRPYPDPVGALRGLAIPTDWKVRNFTPWECLYPSPGGRSFSPHC